MYSLLSVIIVMHTESSGIKAELSCKKQQIVAANEYISEVLMLLGHGYKNIAFFRG